MGLGLRRLARRARVAGLNRGVVRYEPSVWSDDRWELAYGDGTLDYFGSMIELARYSVLTGYVGHVGRGARILEVGCGPGLLRARIPDEWVGDFIGVDPTAGAIEQARQLGAPRSRFVVGTIDDV